MIGGSTKHLQAMMKLAHQLLRRKAVEAGAATTMEYGGKAMARTVRGTAAHRALLASESGAVGQWEYDGTAAWRRDETVRAKASNGVGGATVSCCGRCTKAKEEAGDEMKARGVTGGRWEGEGALWLNVA